MYHFVNNWAQARASAWRDSVAHRAGLTRVHRTGDGADRGPEEEAFECYALCGHCGYLADDAGGPCPGCGEDRWVDLRSKAAAEMLHGVEQQARHEIPPTFRAAGGVGAIVLALAAGAVGWWLGGGREDGAALGVGALAAVFAGAAGWMLVPRGLIALVYRRRPLRPMRWRLPQPTPEPVGKADPVAEGALEVQGELLTAPVSQRPCVGYEVSVLFDAPDDRRPPMWVLEEELLAACTVGGHAVLEDGATLWLEAEPVEFGGEGTSGEEAITTFLRKRGLFASDGEYAVFEAIVEPDQRYGLVRSPAPEGAVPALVRAGGEGAVTTRRVGLRARDAEAVSFKRRHRVGQLLSAALVAVLGAGLWMYFKAQAGPTTFDGQIALLQTCDLSRYKLKTFPCEKALIRALRQMVNEPAKGDVVAAALHRSDSWERQNRLLNLLLRQRRALYPENQQTRPEELAPDPRLAGAVLAMVKRWQAAKARQELVPGVAPYNNRLLGRLRNVVVLTYVLRDGPLSQRAKQRLADALIVSYRTLFRGATGAAKARLIELFKEDFHPQWKVYGTPDP